MKKQIDDSSSVGMVNNVFCRWRSPHLRFIPTARKFKSPRLFDQNWTSVLPGVFIYHGMQRNVSGESLSGSHKRFFYKSWLCQREEAPFSPFRHSMTLHLDPMKPCLFYIFMMLPNAKTKPFICGATFDTIDLGYPHKSI